MGNNQAERGFTLSLREVCQQLGLASPGSLSKHIRTLEDHKLLEGSPGKKRTWRLTQKGWDFIGQPSSPRIPLYGRIAAGTPILAEQNREEELPVDPALFGSTEAFALRVQGDSMVEANIRDGDLAILRPQHDASNGEIVAVMVEGVEPEATLKIWKRRNGEVELQPANGNYPSLVFAAEEQSRITILGLLIGVIRTKP